MKDWRSRTKPDNPTSGPASQPGAISHALIEDELDEDLRDDKLDDEEIAEDEVDRDALENSKLITHNSKLVAYVFPLLTFLALSIIFTWPLLLNFGRDVIGTGESSDVWQHLWNIWWVKQATTTLHTSPFYTNFIFYPDGVSLRFHALNQLGGLFSIPFQALFGLVPAFNTMVIFNLTVAGFGAYLLARDVVQRIYPDYAPALIPCLAAGVAFAYSYGESSFVRLGQLELMSIQWLPFGALFLLRAVLDVAPHAALSPNGRGDAAPAPAPPRNGGGGNKRPLSTFRWAYTMRPYKLSTLKSSPLFVAWLAGFFMVLASQHTWYYGLYLIMFAGLAAIYALMVRWREGWTVRGLVVRQLAVVVGSFALMVSPLLIPMVQELRANPELSANLNTIVYNSIDLPGLFRPGPSTLWGVPTSNDSFWSISIVVGIVALLGLAIVWWDGRGKGMAAFLILSALFFFTLALGPYLKLQAGGLESVVHLGGDDGPTIPLPFLLLNKLPLIGGIARIACRYSIMGMLCLGLLAAVALQWLVQTRNRRKQGYGYQSLAAAIFILMMVEAVPAGGQAMLTPPQSRFFERIGQDPLGSYAIIELSHNSPGLHMYNETVHQQKVMGGYTSRHFDDPFADETPVIRQLYTTEKLENRGDIIERNLPAYGLAVLNYYAIRYLVVHESDYSPGARQDLQFVIDQVWGKDYAPEHDGDLSIYTVTQQANPPAAMEFGSGWNSVEHSEVEGSWRWTTGDAALSIWTPQAMTATLTTTIYSFNRSRHLDVALNGKAIATQEVTTAQQPLTLTLNLQAGLNRIQFHPQAAGEKAPAPDVRTLAIGFKQITLTPLGAR